VEELAADVSKKHNLPKNIARKIVEHRITHVVLPEGQKDIRMARRDEIIGEVITRDLLRWIARRAGREDLEEAVLRGKYPEKVKEFREALKMALSRAIREMAARATPPREDEVRGAITTYVRMLGDRDLAKKLKDAVENGVVPEELSPREVELIREAMLTGALWAPPHWRIRPNNPMYRR